MGQIIWATTNIKSSNRTFTTKSCYRSLENNVASTSSSASFDWRRFWKNRSLCLRIQTFIWRILHNGLAVLSNIARFNSSVLSICSFCKDYEETLEHLFLQCSFSKQVCFASRLNISCLRDVSSLHYLLSDWLHQPDDCYTFNLGCCILWHIWKVRNKSVFDNIAPNGSLVLRNVIKDFEEFGSRAVITLDPTLLPLPSLPSLRVAYWIPPLQPYIKINVDGAFNSHSVPASAVARDCFGIFKGCGTSCFSTLSFLISEATAYLLGVDLAKRLHLTNCIIEGDVAAILKFISGPDIDIPWQLKAIIGNFKSTISFFNDISFVSVPRDANTVAHDLVQFTFVSNVTDWWSSIAPPSCISNSLRQDRALV
ncbi:Reverse transcriptase zinc-binding domain [Macleaya cordata]|uniref:Reverse transcriptase zinc-binding domain n=1 Tax=Macleaya cordata TaxID=56857 RepID=A0A200PPE0_MACCD|nr:Reverse transcriptase zinc-binding domain [Macleaya cordata]